MTIKIAKLSIFVSLIMAVLLLTVPSLSVAEEEPSDGQKYYLGESVNAGKDTGYAEDGIIDENDIHYGWELGHFLISGYTRVGDDDGTPVFLKNVGDEVALSFNLLQDIDQLNGSKDAIIDSDSKGYDQRLGVSLQDFGRGALIIRYTDYQNNRHKPVIYANYLDGVSQGADTAVKALEEGDYEVALDYSIKNVNHGRLPWLNVEIFPGVTDYTMRFAFKVRNGNCMAYPFDVKTGSELTNNAFTENGFRLDLARSRYLSIDVKKENLVTNGDELVTDARFNKPVRDGEKFTDEGVYTLCVANRYTGQSTTKMIYVGSDPVLKAYVATGKSVPEIRSMLADGATVGDDGSIVKAGKTITDALPVEADGDRAGNSGKESIGEFSIIVPVAIALVAASVLIFALIRRTKKDEAVDASGPSNGVR